MNEQQQAFLDEIRAIIHRQPDCEHLFTFGEEIKSLIAEYAGTPEEVTPEMHTILRREYAERKREIERMVSESKIRIAVGLLEASRDIPALQRNHAQAKDQFGAALPLEVQAAYDKRLHELEQAQKSQQKLAEFGLDFGALDGSQFPYCN